MNRWFTTWLLDGSIPLTTEIRNEIPFSAVHIGYDIRNLSFRGTNKVQLNVPSVANKKTLQPSDHTCLSTLYAPPGRDCDGVPSRHRDPSGPTNPPVPSQL